MQKLPLAVDIADAVTEAARSGEPMDVPSTAGRLHRAHPHANVSTDEIAEALNHEAGSLHAASSWARRGRDDADL